MLDSMFQEGTDRVLDDRVARPLQEPVVQPSFAVSAWRTVAAPFKGAGVGVGLEAPAGAMDVAKTFGLSNLLFDDGGAPGAIGSGINDVEVPDELRRRTMERFRSGEAYSSEIGTGLRATAREFYPDPATANAAEEILFGLGRFGGKAVGYTLAGGPIVGAVATGIDEGMTEADRLKAEGVDLGTRTKVGTTAGVAAAAATVLPVSGRTIKQTVGLVAVGGPGAFMAQQAASKAILENAGYDQIADQYDPLDPVGLAVSTLVPAAFGAYALRGRRVAAAKAGRPLADIPAAERASMRYDDERLDDYAVQAAEAAGVPSDVLLAIKNAGEKSNPTAVSPAGAKGVMQFMDDTWQAYGKGDPRDPAASIDAGARYMADLIKQYDGNVRAAIAHYNGGTKAGRAVMEGKAPPAAETRAYLERTDAYMAERSGTAAGRLAAVDPEAIAAARVNLAREALEASGLYRDGDVVAATAHITAASRAGGQIAAGNAVDVADLVDLERVEIGKAYDLVRNMPIGHRFDPMIMIRPEDMEAVAISRGGWKGLGDMEVRGAGYGLVKFIWRHGEESKKSPAMQVSREDLMTFPDVIRRYEPSRPAAEDGSRGREWRVELPGPDGNPRTVVFAENKIEGSEVRQVVSAYVQDTGRPGHDAPLSRQKKTDLGPESLGKRLEAHTEDTQPSFLHQAGQVKSDKSSIAEGAELPSFDSQVAEIAGRNPDMMVQLEGMDTPMRLADALAAVKQEAEAEAKDAPLYQIAAECFLRSQ